MALPDTKVEIAFDSGYSTPAASRTWTDVSTYVEGAQPVGVTRGRQDEVSQVQPSRLVLTLDNRDGRFTPRLSSGAYYPNVKKGRPIRVTSTYNAVDYVRFTGYISEWPVVWPDGTDVVSTVTVTCVSRMARTGRGAEMRSLLEEEILADGPDVYYTLGDPTGSLTAVDSSGNQAPDLTMAGEGTDVVFGNATGPTDGLTAAEFAGGRWLTTSQSVVGGVAECYFSRTGNPSVAEILLAFAASSGLVVGIAIDTDGTITTSGSDLGSSPVVTDGEVHSLSWQSGHVLVDGVDIGSPTNSPVTGVLKVGGIGVGYTFSGTGAPVTQLTGAMSHVAAFTTLSTARAAEHAGAGLTGSAGESSDDRIARLAAIAGVPTAEQDLDAGSSTVGAVESGGATPLAAMLAVAETENGVLFDAKDGKLTFQGRDARYTTASAFTLSAASQQVEADLSPVDDDQFVVNDVTASANGVPAGRVVDTASQDDFGIYKQTLDTITDNTADALAGAQWRVALGKDPAPRYSTVSVDVTNSSTALAAAVMAAEIGTRFTLADLPATAPATSVDLFVEGYTETITATSHRVTFNTSPAAGYDVWTIEDAVFGQYDAYPIAY